MRSTPGVIRRISRNITLNSTGYLSTINSYIYSIVMKENIVSQCEETPTLAKN